MHRTTVSAHLTRRRVERRLPGLAVEEAAEAGDLIDDGVSASDMNGWGPAQVERSVLQATAHSVGREAHGLPFRQLFNLHYADDAKMLSWGGIVTSTSLDRTIDACRFDDLDFVRTGEEAIEISVPVLTEREITYLETELVGSTTGVLPKIKGVESKDIKAFAQVYRWRVGIR